MPDTNEPFFGQDTAEDHPYHGRGPYPDDQPEREGLDQYALRRTATLIRLLNTFVNSFDTALQRRTALEVIIYTLYPDFKGFPHSPRALFTFTGYSTDNPIKDLAWFQDQLYKHLATEEITSKEARSYSPWLITHLSFINLGSTTSCRHMRFEILLVCQDYEELPYQNRLHALAQFCKPGTSKQNTHEVKAQFTDIFPHYKGHQIFKNKQGPKPPKN